MSHNTQFTGIWKIVAVPYDGHTAIVSASADGSVRTGFSFHSMFLRGVATELYAQELARVHDAKEESLSGNGVTIGGTSSSSSSSNNGGAGRMTRNVVSVTLDQNTVHNKNLTKIQMSNVPAASISMHTVDCSFLNSKSENDNKLECLFVYGGASGIIRVHTNNMKMEAILN